MGEVSLASPRTNGYSNLTSKPERFHPQLADTHVGYSSYAGSFGTWLSIPCSVCSACSFNNIITCGRTTPAP